VIEIDGASWVGREDILFREIGIPPPLHIEIYASKVQWAAIVRLTSEVVRIVKYGLTSKPLHGIDTAVDD
jgi:hypothetical protein